MKAVICPVCMGSGIVDAGFYLRISQCWTNVGGTEVCRGCGGKGWISVPDEQEYPQFSIYQPPKTTG